MTNVDAFAGRSELVVLAGAGVSAGKPSSLPGWNATNAAIVRVLCHRLETAINRPGWLSRVVAAIDEERTADRFPPDYQAQLIEEMCGERYFRALQALDVDAFNAGHDGIAALAVGGTVRAVVTTNFDRLIERALDRRGTPYVVAYDDAGFEQMCERLREGQWEPLPILNMHGCVSDHRSMIDTLKQRKRGRSRHLQAFAASSWLACSWLWLSDGLAATAIASDLLNALAVGHWESAQPARPGHA